MNGRAWMWLGVALSAGIGCSSMTGITPIPKSQDNEMGRAFAAEIDSQLPVEKDPKVTEGCARIVQKILESNGLAKDYEWQVQVVRDDGTVNAFALPGGKMYVFTGLIAAADDEAEVAGVLAHEIAHVTERHGAERMTDQYGAQVVQQILLGDHGTLANVFANAATKVGFLHFSRKQESEADSVGFKFLTKTDYDPNGMTRFFEKIAAMSGKTGAVEGFLSDHPDPAARVESTKKAIAKLPPPRQTGQTYKERYLAYREMVVPRGLKPAAPSATPPAPR